MKVLRLMFQRFFAGSAPIFAAVQLLGPEATTLHKCANQGADVKAGGKTMSAGGAGRDAHEP